MLELKVKAININLPVNHPILEKCRPLYEYSWFIQKIKDYMSVSLRRDEAIIHAMADCEREGIMTDFLREHGSEVVNMLFTEFNMEDALDVRYGEGKAEGLTVIVSSVRKKLTKGLDTAEITDMLEINPELVERISAAVSANPQASDLEIAQAL